MKSTVAIALIVMGGFLIMTPAIADYFHERNAISLLSQPGVHQVNLNGAMSSMYSFGCWLTGTMMVGVAVLSSVPSRRREGTEAVRVYAEAAQS